jgi:uncharacterized protein YndB with AHSA1/START domain
MPRIEESVEIKCPVEKVFAYVANAKSWPKWHLSMLEADQTSPGAIGVGATFRGVNKVMGRWRAWTSKVTEYETNKMWRQSIASGGTLIDEHLSFESAGKGTKFTQVYDMKVGGFLRLFAPIVTGTMRKELKTDLTSLKGIVEAQS